MIQVYKIDKERVFRFIQFISEKLRKSRPQFWKKLRELRLRQNNSFTYI